MKGARIASIAILVLVLSLGAARAGGPSKKHGGSKGESAAKFVPLDEVDAPPSLVKRAPIKGPSAAKEVNGTVTLEVTVTAKGDVKDPKISHPLHPEADRLAKAAVVKYKFKPAMKDGNPVDTKIEIPIAFVHGSSDGDVESH